MPLQWKAFWKLHSPRRPAFEITPFDKLCQDLRRLDQCITPAQSQYLMTACFEELTRCQSILYEIKQKNVLRAAESPAAAETGV